MILLSVTSTITVTVIASYYQCYFCFGLSFRCFMGLCWVRVVVAQLESYRDPIMLSLVPNPRFRVEGLGL